MSNLTGDRNRAADIGPAANLADGKHVPGFEQNVSVGFAGECTIDGYIAVLQVHVITIDNGVAGEVGSLLVGAAFEAAGQAHEICGSHTLGERILSRPQDLTVN